MCPYRLRQKPGLTKITLDTAMFPYRHRQRPDLTKITLHTAKYAYRLSQKPDLTKLTMDTEMSAGQSITDYGKNLISKNSRWIQQCVPTGSAKNLIS